MWRFANADIVENVDDPRDFLFVRHPIAIVRHRPCGRYETIEAGFASVEAAKKWLTKLVASGSDDIKPKPIGGNVMKVYVTFYDDGSYVIDSDSDKLTAMLLADNELTLCLDDAQDVIGDIIDQFEEDIKS